MAKVFTYCKSCYARYYIDETGNSCPFCENKRRDQRHIKVIIILLMIAFAIVILVAP